jgi:hypothetical protein
MSDAMALNSSTPSFPAEDAAQGAPLDNVPSAPPNALGTEMHQEQAATEARAQAEAAEAERVAAEQKEAKAAEAAEKKKEKLTLDEVMERAAKRLAEKNAAKEAEAPKEPQARTENGKFAAKEQPAPEVETKPAEQPQQQTPKHQAPARFHDVAKSEWDAAPESVKGEVLRTIRELEAGHQKYKEDAGRFNELRDYHEMAERSGTDLRSALSNYVETEKLLRTDPVAGLQSLLKTIDMHPVAAIDAILRSNNTSLAQFADAVVKNPEKFNFAPPQRADPVAHQAMQEVQALKAELQAQRAANEIIAPFRASHPRYDALQDDIASILKSGSIPSNLPPQERLSMAYAEAESRAMRYAEMFSAPGAQTAAPQPLAQTQMPRPVVNPAGLKSISGAPSTVQPTGKAIKRGPLPSIEESLRRAQQALR